MSDYPGYDVPYGYGGSSSGTGGTRGSGGASAQPTTRTQKKSQDKPWWQTVADKWNNDPIYGNATFTPMTGPIITNNSAAEQYKAAQAAAELQARYGYSGAAAQKQWLANNPAMQITLGNQQLDAMSALERRRMLMEKYAGVQWDLPQPKGWQTGITGPYGIVSGVGLEGDPLQDLPIWRQIAYLPSSEPIRKVLGVYGGPTGYAGGGGGGGGGEAQGQLKGKRGGGGGGGGDGGNMGYPPNGVYKNQRGYLPQWANNLVAWRTG